MTYIYTCQNCNKEILINKPMSESDLVEHCDCGAVLKRVYESLSIKTSDGVKK